jgi:hypothetical protein
VARTHTHTHTHTRTQRGGYCQSLLEGTPQLDVCDTANHSACNVQHDAAAVGAREIVRGACAVGVLTLTEERRDLRGVISGLIWGLRMPLDVEDERE